MADHLILVRPSVSFSNEGAMAEAAERLLRRPEYAHPLERSLRVRALDMMDLAAIRRIQVAAYEALTKVGY